MNPAEQIAMWADKLRDISANGLAFSESVYDRENYHQIQDMALAMFALATNQSLEQLTPLKETILKAPTPFSTGDAAIINKAGQILLIQRSDNKLWAMPGGAMSVGETPSEGAVREALEETGVACKVVAFVGVYDSRLRNTVSPHHLYQYVFLCQPLHQGQQIHPPTHPLEVLDQGWFAEEALPTNLDPGHVKPIAHSFRAWQGNYQVYFD